MRKLLSKALRGVRNFLNVVLPSAFLLAGACAVTAGVCMIYLPAGMIVAGVLSMAGGILLIVGGGDDDA